MLPVVYELGVWVTVSDLGYSFRSNTTDKVVSHTSLKLLFEGGTYGIFQVLSQKRPAVDDRHL